MARVLFTDHNGAPAFVESNQVIAAVQNLKPHTDARNFYTHTVLYIGTFEQGLTVRGTAKDIGEQLLHAELAEADLFNGEGDDWEYEIEADDNG